MNRAGYIGVPYRAFILDFHIGFHIGSGGIILEGLSLRGSPAGKVPGTSPKFLATHRSDRSNIYWTEKFWPTIYWKSYWTFAPQTKEIRIFRRLFCAADLQKSGKINHDIEANKDGRGQKSKSTQELALRLKGGPAAQRTHKRSHYFFPRACGARVFLPAVDEADLDVFLRGVVFVGRSWRWSRFQAVKTLSNDATVRGAATSR